MSRIGLYSTAGAALMLLGVLWVLGGQPAAAPWRATSLPRSADGPYFADEDSPFAERPVPARAVFPPPPRAPAVSTGTAPAPAPAGPLRPAASALIAASGPTLALATERSYAAEPKAEAVESTSQPRIPAGWSREHEERDKYAIALDDQVAYDGSGSLLLESQTGTLEEWNSSMQRIRADQFRGRRVALTARIRAQDVTGMAHIWLRVDGSNGQVVTNDNMHPRALRGSSDWQEFRLVADVPADAIGLAFGSRLHGSGRVWLDNVRLEPVPNSEPVTGEAGRRRVNPLAPDAPLAPFNPGFESDVAP